MLGLELRFYTLFRCTQWQSVEYVEFVQRLQILNCNIWTTHLHIHFIYTLFWIYSYQLFKGMLPCQESRLCWFRHHSMHIARRWCWNLSRQFMWRYCKIAKQYIHIYKIYSLYSIQFQNDDSLRVLFVFKHVQMIRKALLMIENRREMQNIIEHRFYNFVSVANR